MSFQSINLELLQSSIAVRQYVLSLDPRTLIPIDLAAPTIGMSAHTFRGDVTRRPERLPRLTRVGGRIFVLVKDILEWIDKQRDQSQPEPRSAATKNRRGRLNKTEEIARRQAGGHHG